MRISPDLLQNAFVKEYEFNASARLIFPYIENHIGLAEWFSERATQDSAGLYHFWWDKQDHLAVRTSLKLNKSVRFSFIDDIVDATRAHDTPGEFPFIEFALVPGNFSQGVFLKVTDTTIASGDDQEEIWDDLVHHLHERVAGQ